MCCAKAIKKTKNAIHKWRNNRVSSRRYNLIQDPFKWKGKQDSGAYLCNCHHNSDNNQEAVAFQVAKQETYHRYFLPTSTDRHAAISLSMADSSSGRGLLRRLTRRVAILNRSAASYSHVRCKMPSTAACSAPSSSIVCR